MRRGETLGLGAVLVGLALVTVAIESRCTALRMLVAEQRHHHRAQIAQIMALQARIAGCRTSAGRGILRRRIEGLIGRLNAELE